MVTEAGTTGEDRARPQTSQFSQWPGFCSSFYLVKMIFNKRERESEMSSICTKSTNLKHVQEKEEEEKRLLGGELHTQTSPSGQVTAPLLLIFV